MLNRQKSRILIVLPAKVPSGIFRSLLFCYSFLGGVASSMLLYLLVANICSVASSNSLVYQTLEAAVLPITVEVVGCDVLLLTIG